MTPDAPSAPSPPRQPAAPDLPLPSPTMHPATSPSTVQASPSSTPHPAALPDGATRHVRPNDAPKARARLACLLCRRSKIRCGPNNGEIVRPCPQCAKGNKLCQWPDDNPSSAHPVIKRSDPAAHEASPDQRPSESRKRRKPPVGSFERLSMADSDLIVPKNITDSTWDELYTIFRHHFATELPFLHEITFLRDVKRNDNHRQSPGFDALRLAFLALTVPFHDDFGRQPSSDPLRTARKYAESAERHINFYALSSPTIEIPQALLMLSLRAHGEGQGSRSFMMLGIAVKAMQLLNCQFDHELVDKEIDDKKRSSTKRKAPEEQKAPEDSPAALNFVMEEIRRRTFWSCFIVDRYISSGDYKPRNISLEDPLVLVQLPCSEDNFDIGTKTKTRKLRESDEDFKRREKKYLHDHPEDANVDWEDEDKQSPLVWFIKALDLFGDVMRYTCTVTRRAERKWPWHEDSEHYKLDEKVENLISKLPAVLKLTPTVRDVAMSPPYRRRATPYILLHSTLLICKIALHREYLPYFTRPKSYPEGPGDGPNWEALQKACEREDPEFFKRSARTFFKATKNGFDLLTSSRIAGTLVESPLTAFVSYAVAFNIMWLTFFPNFDQDGVLCQGTDGPDDLVAHNFKNAFTILRHLQKRLILARSFGKRLKKLFDDLFDCKIRYSDPASPTEMKVSHSLKAYLPLENDHKEFGDEVAQIDNVAFEEAPDVGILVDVYKREHLANSHYSPATKSEVKMEIASPMERAPESRSEPAISPSFTSVNAASNHISTPHQHQPASYQQPYQSAGRSSSIRVAPESQQYGTSYNPPPGSRESVAPGSVDHRSIHPGGTTSVNNFSDYYLSLPYNGDNTQGHFMMDDLGYVFTGNTSAPTMEDYSTQQPAYWHSY